MDLAKRYGTWFVQRDYNDARRDVAKLLRALPAAFDGTPDDEATIRWTCSREVGFLIDSVEVTDSPAWPTGPHIHLSRLKWHYVEILKYITRNYVIRKPTMALYQRGRQNLLLQLVDLMLQWAEDEPRRLPPVLRDAWDLAVARDEPGGVAIGYVRPARPDRGTKYRSIVRLHCVVRRRRINIAVPRAVRRGIWWSDCG